MSSWSKTRHRVPDYWSKERRYARLCGVSVSGGNVPGLTSLMGNREVRYLLEAWWISLAGDDVSAVDKSTYIWYLERLLYYLFPDDCKREIPTTIAYDWEHDSSDTGVLNKESFCCSLLHMTLLFGGYTSLATLPFLQRMHRNLFDCSNCIQEHLTVNNVTVLINVESMRQKAARAIVVELWLRESDREPPAEQEEAKLIVDAAIDSFLGSEPPFDLVTSDTTETVVNKVLKYVNGGGLRMMRDADTQQSILMNTSEVPLCEAAYWTLDLLLAWFSVDVTKQHLEQREIWIPPRGRSAVVCRRFTSEAVAATLRHRQRKSVGGVYRPRRLSTSLRNKFNSIIDTHSICSDSSSDTQIKLQPSNSDVQSSNYKKSSEVSNQHQYRHLSTTSTAVLPVVQQRRNRYIGKVHIMKRRVWSTPWGSHHPRPPSHKAAKLELILHNRRAPHIPEDPPLPPSRQRLLKDPRILPDGFTLQKNARRVREIEEELYAIQQSRLNAEGEYCGYREWAAQGFRRMHVYKCLKRHQFIKKKKETPPLILIPESNVTG